MLQVLDGYDFQSLQYYFIVIAVFVFLVLFYYLRKRFARIFVADEVSSDSPKAPASEPPGQSIPQVSVPKLRVVSVEEPPVAAPKLPVAETGRQNVPQDSVLRRHHLAHVKYMIETVTPPCPTESVLRRHYDQLVASELDACLRDDAQMKRLIHRYEEHRRNA